MPTGGLLVFYRWQTTDSLLEAPPQVKAAVTVSETKQVMGVIWRGQGRGREALSSDGQIRVEDGTACVFLHAENLKSPFLFGDWLRPPNAQSLARRAQCPDCLRCTPQGFALRSFELSTVDTTCFLLLDRSDAKGLRKIFYIPSAPSRQ